MNPKGIYKQNMNVRNGWILCSSKTFPGKCYYFNVHTGEAAWNCNELEKPRNMGPNKAPETSKFYPYPEPSCPPMIMPYQSQPYQSQPYFNQNFITPPWFGNATFRNFLPNDYPPMHTNYNFNQFMPKPYFPNPPQKMPQEKLPDFECIAQTTAIPMNKRFTNYIFPYKIIVQYKNQEKDYNCVPEKRPRLANQIEPGKVEIIRNFLLSKPNPKPQNEDNIYQKHNQNTKINAGKEEQVMMRNLDQSKPRTEVENVCKCSVNHAEDINQQQNETELQELDKTIRIIRLEKSKIQKDQSARPMLCRSLFSPAQDFEEPIKLKGNGLENKESKELPQSDLRLKLLAKRKIGTTAQEGENNGTSNSLEKENPPKKKVSFYLNNLKEDFESAHDKDQNGILLTNDKEYEVKAKQNCISNFNKKKNNIFFTAELKTVTFFNKNSDNFLEDNCSQSTILESENLRQNTDFQPASPILECKSPKLNRKIQNLNEKATSKIEKKSTNEKEVSKDLIKENFNSKNPVEYNILGDLMPKMGNKFKIQKDKTTPKYKCRKESSGNIENLKKEIEEGLKGFSINNDDFEERLRSRKDELVCRYTQIMEDALTSVLMESTSPYIPESPWSLHEACQCLNEKYGGNQKVEVLAEKLGDTLSQFQDKGAIKADIDIADLMTIFGLGVILIETLMEIPELNEILKEPDCNLKKILKDIEDPTSDDSLKNLNSIDFDEIIMDEGRKVKNTADVAGYQRRHYPHLKEYCMEDTEDSNEEVKIPHQTESPSVLQNNNNEPHNGQTDNGDNDNENNASGFVLSDEREHVQSVVNMFLNEIKRTFLFFYNFIKSTEKVIQERELSENKKKILVNETNIALERVNDVTSRLKSIIHREQSDWPNTVAALATRMTHCRDARVQRYRQVLTKCLEQGEVIRASLVTLNSAIKADYEERANDVQALLTSAPYYN